MTTRAPLSPARSTRVEVARRPALMRWSWPWRWESAVAVVAVVAAVAAFWVTINAKFLEYPYWLAVQKADFILGPVFVGLYWHHRRPNNRLGLMMIALGLVNIVYILESTSSPYLFPFGVMTEAVYTPLAFAIVLAFPNGRLDGPVERLLLAGVLLAVTVPYVVWLLVLPHLPARGSLAVCRVLCPRNPYAIWATPSWYPQSVDFFRASLSLIDFATVGLLVWKFVTGTPPRRRALAIGAPIAVCWLLAQGTYQTLLLVQSHFSGATARNLYTPLQWVVAAFRSAPWYGFLFALIAAELFAGRTLRRLVSDSLGRPSLRELEGMLRGPLGDPGLRLGFWRPRSRDWADADGDVLAPPGLGQTRTEVERDGRPVAAIVHDSQLSEDPELLQAAGAVALLALENAELDAAWKESLDELADSRARLVSTGARERRKLERDLHDGAQQRLVAASIDLSLAGELAGGDVELRERVNGAGAEVEAALVELRELAHGIYPRALGRWGLAPAFDVLAARYPGRVRVTEATAARFPPEVEAAVYYCGLEAVQNASKHAGRDVQVSIRLSTEADQLHLEVRDNGPGFDVRTVHDGVGLQNMRDRMGAVRGTVEIVSDPGHGTLVAASAPLQRAA